MRPKPALSSGEPHTIQLPRLSEKLILFSYTKEQAMAIDKIKRRIIGK